MKTLLTLEINFALKVRVMEELHSLDEVAYVRFASVYRAFQDVDAFREEIDRMRHRRSREAAEAQLALWTAAEAERRKK